MKVELIKDTQGENNVIHITGIKDSELADIERRLQAPAKLTNFYDRYGATESLNSILNGLIALCGREQRNELKKSRPDINRILELKRLGEEVWAINEDNAMLRLS